MNVFPEVLQVVYMTEWQSAFIPARQLLPAEIEFLETSELVNNTVIRIENRDGGIQLETRSWVGHLRFQQFEVRIAPKLVGGNEFLVDLIEIATSMDAFRVLSMERAVEFEQLGLFDLIALLFIERCEAVIRQGILSDYIEHKEDLALLRGSLLVTEQIRRRYGQIDKLCCRYDEPETNILENKILVTALEATKRRASDSAVRQRASKIFSLFADLCDVAPPGSHIAKSDLTYNRLNGHYRRAHELAWILLEDQGIRNLYNTGVGQCFAFLLDMDDLFERFVFKYVESLLPNDFFAVTYHFPHNQAVIDLATGQNYMTVIPDILIQKRIVGRQSLPADAKYKLYDNCKISSDDLYQTFFYAQAFADGAAGRTPRCALIYPTSTPRLVTRKLRVLPPHGAELADIVTIGLPLPLAIHEMRRGLGPLSQSVLRELLSAF